MAARVASLTSQYFHPNFWLHLGEPTLEDNPEQFFRSLDLASLRELATAYVDYYKALHALITYNPPRPLSPCYVTSRLVDYALKEEARRPKDEPMLVVETTVTGVTNQQGALVVPDPYRDWLYENNADEYSVELFLDLLSVGHDIRDGYGIDESEEYGFTEVSRGQLLQFMNKLYQASLLKGITLLNQLPLRPGRKGRR